MDKKDCVGAFDGAKPLCKASDFIGIRCLPDRAFAASTEFAIFGNRAGVRVDVVPMHGVVETHVGDNSAAGEWRLGGTSIVDEKGTCARRDMTQMFRSCCVRSMHGYDARASRFCRQFVWVEGFGGLLTRRLGALMSKASVSFATGTGAVGECHATAGRWERREGDNFLAAGCW
jgi:hypothetical protein